MYLHTVWGSCKVLLTFSVCSNIHLKCWMSFHPISPEFDDRYLGWGFFFSSGLHSSSALIYTVLVVTVEATIFSLLLFVFLINFRCTCRVLFRWRYIAAVDWDILESQIADRWILRQLHVEDNVLRCISGICSSKDTLKTALIFIPRQPQKLEEHYVSNSGDNIR